MAEDAALEEPAPKRRGVVWTVLRLAIGLGLIAFLTWRTDTEAWSQLFARAELVHFLAALGLMVSVLLVSAVRWLVFLRSLGFGERAGHIVQLSLAGTFFNVFLPTGLGGDAYKVVRLGRRQRRLSSALASVFLDRLSAIVALAAIALVATTSRAVEGSREPAVVLAAGASAGIILVTFGLFTFRRRLARLGRPGSGVRARLGRVLTAVGAGSEHAGSVARAFVLALVAQLLLVAAHTQIAAALRLDLPVAAVAGGLVLTILAATAPVTVNGLGIREAVWVWALSAYGVGTAAGLAFALAALGVLVAASLLGGFAFVAGGRGSD